MSDKRPIMSINENEALELLNNIFENAELIETCEINKGEIYVEIVAFLNDYVNGRILLSDNIIKVCIEDKSDGDRIPFEISFAAFRYIDAKFNIN